MQKASKQPQHNPWYKNINIWAWIITGLAIVATIIILSIEDAEEERAKDKENRPRSYEEIFTPEEQKKMGIGKKADGPGDWNPDPNGARRFREFIEEGGNADPASDAIQDGDYHDLLDQNGGPEGF